MFTAFLCLGLFLIIPSIYGWWLERKRSRFLDECGALLDMGATYIYPEGSKGKQPTLSQYEALCSVGEDELRDHLTRLDKVAYRDTHRNLVAFDAEEEEPTTIQAPDGGIELAPGLYTYPAITSVWMDARRMKEDVELDAEVDDAFARIIR